MPHIFIGDSPRLEAVYEEKGPGPCVVITHPHSLMGGNMNNNVVMAAWDTALAEGSSVIRFNFRGVGRSGGSFDEGNGEISDIAAVVQFVNRPVIIIGYSFGAWVAARYMKRLENALPCFFISPPTGMFAFPSMKQDRVWAVTGDLDQFCSIPVLENLMDASRLAVVKEVDHFWFGDEGLLKEHLSATWEELVQESR
jgi:alpha/beta superfamily hydrolase